MKNKIVTFMLVSIISGCGKSDEVAPVISVDSPSENQMFSSGQTVTVRATVSDNEDLHTIHIDAVDNSGGHWIHSEEHVDTKTFEINKSYITNPGKTYTITIQATDHNENTTTKEITVSSN